MRQQENESFFKKWIQNIKDIKKPMGHPKRKASMW